MLQGKNSTLHTAQENIDSNVAVSPLAVPLLAGHGTIATAMNYSAAGGWADIAVTVLVFAALCIITLICFVFSSHIISVIGGRILSIAAVIIFQPDLPMCIIISTPDTPHFLRTIAIFRFNTEYDNHLAATFSFMLYCVGFSYYIRQPYLYLKKILYR